MFRVLVACDNKILTKNLQDILGDCCKIETCGNGKWMLELYNIFSPDIVVVDDCLVDMDALSLIRAIRANGGHEGIILLSTLLNPTVESQVRKLGVNALLLKPCRPNVIASRVRFLAALLMDPDNQYWNVEDEAGILLADLSFRMGPDRYRQVLQAILIRYTGDPGMLMKNVYLEIAKMNGGNILSVEKAIRDAIVLAWNDGNPQLWDMYFKPKWNRERAHPSNEEFITRLVASLKRRERLKLPLYEEKIG